MSRPTTVQQERARTRIKQMIATRPAGRTTSKEKLRIGKLLGYKGKDSNIIRSVDRVITTDRNSPSARNLRSKEQVRKIDRSWRNRMKGIEIGGKSTTIDITDYVKPIVTIEDMSDPNFDVWKANAIQSIGKIVFGERRGIIRGFYLRFTGQAKTFDGGYNINSLQGQFPLATTFGYLDNKEDLYYIWNLRVRFLFSTSAQYSCTKAIFAQSAVPQELLDDPETAEEITEEVKLVMGYYKGQG